MKEAVRQSVEAGLNVRCTFRSPGIIRTPVARADSGRRTQYGNH